MKGHLPLSHLSLCNKHKHNRFAKVCTSVLRWIVVYTRGYCTWSHTVLSATLRSQCTTWPLRGSPPGVCLAGVRVSSRFRLQALGRCRRPHEGVCALRDSCKSEGPLSPPPLPCVVACQRPSASSFPTESPKVHSSRSLRAHPPIFVSFPVESSVSAFGDKGSSIRLWLLTV